MRINELGRKTVILLLCFVGTFNLLAQPCYSDASNVPYDYRLPINLDNSLNAEIDNYQIQVVLNTSTLVSAGKMQSSGGDIRFLDRLGNPLSFWVEDGSMNTASTKIWIKTDSILGYSKDTIYMYYGKSGASSESNKASTFDVYDDFSGSTLGVGWSACGGGSASVSSGALTLSSAAATKKTITSVASFAGPLLVEMGVTSSSAGTNFVGSINTSGSGYALLQNANMGIHKMTTSSCYTNTSVNTSVATGSVTGMWSFTWANVGSQSGSWPGGSSTATDNTISTSLNNKIIFGNMGGGSMVVDWIRARKYSANSLPLSFGAEVTMVYTINPSYNSPICEGSDLQLTVNTVVGATYKWTGPSGSGFTSSLREPLVNGVNLNDAGQYQVEVKVPTGCVSRNKTVNVSVTAESEGGTLSGSTTVCGGANTGTVTLINQVGNITSWDTATSSAGPWGNVTSMSNSRAYNDLTTTTYYRVIVKNGTCSPDTSTNGVISVTAPSSGGTVTGHDTVCSGSNSGILNVSSNVGNIERWEKSLNGFLWNTIVNRSTVQAYTNLTQTTFFRAIAKNGLCDEAISTPQSIIVDAQSVGGTVSGVTSTCQGSNQGTLFLNGQLGDVVRWETSTTGSSPWNSVTNTTDSIQFSNLTSTTYHRAIVRNGSCNLTASSSSAVTIIPSSDGGTLSGSGTVCESANSGTLSASGYTGTITKWQYKTASTSGWQDIANTANSLSWGSLTDTTEYRVIVSNMGCAADSSSIAAINVDKSTQSGYITGTTTVCAGTNSGTLNLNSSLGNILKWEVSNTGFAPWSVVSNTTTSLNFTNLSSNKYYRTIVKNGVCSQSNSNSIYVKVDQPTVGGNTDSDLEICSGTNYGLISLRGYNGEIKYWQQTDDSSASGTWSPITNFTNRQDFRDLSATTYYRAVVQSGSCASANSSVTTIKVSEPTVSGIIEGDTSFCAALNSGVISLNNSVGDIVRWEYSMTGSNPWNVIPNTTTINSYSNLASSTFFRAIVKNGACSQQESPVAAVAIYPSSTAGVLSSDDTSICSNVNFGSLSLNEFEGNIQKWEISTDNGSSWSAVNNTTSQQYFFNLKETSSYRVFVQNGECDAVVSNNVEVVVDDVPIGGFVTPVTEACINNASGFIKVNQSSGTFSKWQTGLSDSGPWIDEAGSIDSIAYLNPSITKYYRAELSGGACGSVYSQPGVLFVYNETAAGTLVGGGIVCDSANAGELILTSMEGQVVNWEKASSLAGPWVAQTQNASTYNYFNIHEPTKIRARVQNGVCPDALSNVISFEISPVPSANFKAANLCGGRIAEFKDISSISSGSITDYFWTISDGFSTADKKFSKAFLNSGSFLVNLQVRSDNGCTDVITKSVIVNDAPLANFRFDGDLGNGVTCNTDTLSFVNLTDLPTTGTYDYEWNFGDGTTSTLLSPVKQFSAAGTYNVRLKVLNNANCDDSISRYVTVYKTIKPNAGEDETISKGIGHKLVGSGGLLYAWTPANLLDNPNSSSPIAKLNSSQEFVLETVDQNGCTGRDTVVMTILEDFRVRPNNVITPDGNGMNDAWIVQNIENYPNNTVSVIDRWGRTVMSAKGYQNDWNATDEDGATLMDGTYYYVISFDDSDVVYKGAISVVNNK